MFNKQDPAVIKFDEMYGFPIMVLIESELRMYASVN